LLIGDCQQLVAPLQDIAEPDEGLFTQTGFLFLVELGGVFALAGGRENACTGGRVADTDFLDRSQLWPGIEGIGKEADRSNVPLLVELTESGQLQGVDGIPGARFPLEESRQPALQLLEPLAFLHELRKERIRCDWTWGKQVESALVGGLCFGEATEKKQDLA